MSGAAEALKALAEGFATTFRHLFRKPITEQYPEYKRPLPERTRARIVLTCDPDGKERCVACYLCAVACPVDCIAGEKKELHVIDTDACIRCGVCRDKCKFDAVHVV